MRLRALILACAALAACATNPPVPTAPWVGRYANACVPEAAAMAQGLRGADIQARVLILQTPAYSHAATAYLYPPGSNSLWVWDSYWKSTTVRAYWSEPVGIANAWLQKCGRPERARSARFLEIDAGLQRIGRSPNGQAFNLQSEIRNQQSAIE